MLVSVDIEPIIWLLVANKDEIGRVARAGRIGAAYSLVSNDELPYVIDLHLFLGRPLIFAEEGKSYQEGSFDNFFITSGD